MDRKQHALMLDTMQKIEALAKKTLEATRYDEETDEMEDARNYLLRIVEEAEEAQGQWWA